MSYLVDARNKSAKKISFGKSVKSRLELLCLYGRCMKKNTSILPQWVRCTKNNSVPGARVLAGTREGWQGHGSPVGLKYSQHRQNKQEETKAKIQAFHWDLRGIQYCHLELPSQQIPSLENVICFKFCDFKLRLTKKVFDIVFIHRKCSIYMH